ncbi:MAG: AAA family ATPase [Oscillospiraceae bacterium]|nr:AAA family ATPase [Oscillospiraceae bacterium]
MIKKIIVHNFQSYSHEEVELDKHMNVVIGESGSGKTAFWIRALKWVMFNEGGRNYIRQKIGGKVLSSGEQEKEAECYVTVEFTDGQVLTRKKTKTKNIYTLINQNGEILNFENFGKVVPIEIRRSIGISKFVVDKDLSFNINIIRPKEKSLIEMNGFDKAKILGTYAGTNILDISCRNIKKDSVSATSDKHKLEKEVESLDKKLEEFPDFDAIDAKMAVINKLNVDIEVKKDKVKVIKALLSKIRALETEITTHQENLNNRDSVDEAETVLTKIETLYETITKKTNTLQTLKNKKDVLIDLDEKIRKCKLFTDCADRVQRAEQAVSNTEIKISSIEKKISEKTEKLKAIKKIKTTVDGYTEQLDRVGRNILALNKEKDKYAEEYINEIKKYGKCPICMQELDETHFDEIKGEL